jgi:hypothetical protein
MHESETNLTCRKKTDPLRNASKLFLSNVEKGKVEKAITFWCIYHPHCQMKMVRQCKVLKYVHGSSTTRKP